MAPRTSASPSAVSSSALAGDGSAHLLLVEDHADLRTYVARLLNSQGWSVTAVATADEGRDLVESHDLVITDLMLPGTMSGIDLVRWMRQNPETTSTTAIVLTARAGVGAFMEALDAGADAFLTKPFDPDALIARVSAHLSLDSLVSTKAGDPASQLRSNRTVRTAAAMLMAADGATAEAAFARLAEQSELHKSAITDLAQGIVMSGRLASSR